MEQKISSAPSIRPTSKLSSTPATSTRTPSNRVESTTRNLPPDTKSFTSGLDPVRNEILTAQRSLREIGELLHRDVLPSKVEFNGEEFRAKMKETDENIKKWTEQQSLEDLLRDLNENGGDDPDVRDLKKAWDTTKELSSELKNLTETGRKQLPTKPRPH